MADQSHQMNNLDVRHWLHHAIPPLISLLRATGSYSASDQGEIIQFICDHALPYFGPRPATALAVKSMITQSGFPLELSLNLSYAKPKIRCCWEIFGPHGIQDDDLFSVEALKTCLASLSDRLGSSRRWSDLLLATLTPTQEEATVAQNSLTQWQISLLPPGVTPIASSRLPFSAVAVDLDGSRILPKLYINPQVKEIGSGSSMNETIWGILRSVKPSISPKAIEAVSQFLTERPGRNCMDMISIDLPSDAELHRARFKIYVHTTSNSFQTVRQCMTLGGRRQDEVTLKGLEILRSIWHLLLQEKGEVADDHEHPIHNPSALAAKLFFCLEITPGQDLPDVKLHMPVFGYVKNEEEALQNLEKILHTCNQQWADGGKYRDMFETTFGDPKADRSAIVHNYMSFQHRETGVYQTIYMSPPSKVE